MGAAASTTPAADDLAARVESWVTSGGDRCAAALAALEAASPALAAALRSADADAVRGALAAPAAADGAEANAADSAAPTTKRYKPSENSGAAFVRAVLQKEGNASKVLQFAGYRTVLRLEEVCKPARTALRNSKLELDVSKERNPVLAIKHAARHELLEARRQGSFPLKNNWSYIWRYSESGVLQSTADVLYRDDRVLLTSPRPSQVFRATSGASGRGLNVRDEERSKASLVAFESSRASLLAVGCFLIDLDHREGDHAAVKSRNSFVNTFSEHASNKKSMPKKIDDALASKLVEAMGGERAIPRRLVLAARCTKSRGRGGPPADLDRAIRFAADKSAVLGVDQLERLASALWRIMALRGEEEIPGLCSVITEAIFLGACADAHISDSDAAVAWREACSGVLLPFEPKVAGFDLDVGEMDFREPGDVRHGDVDVVGFWDWLVSPVGALALARLQNGMHRDASQCFSAKDFYALSKTFESLVVREQIEDQDLRLAMLAELAFRRDGETDAGPGRARVAEALSSLLTPDRVATLAVGSAVEYGSGEPTTWASATVVESPSRGAIALIRVEGEEEPKAVGIGALRLVEERPSAAAIMLAHAVKNNRNDIVVQLLASPLMAAPLSFVVGAPGKNVAVRDDARATALDHAISSRNAVAVGLLTRNYVNTWDAWTSVLSTHDASDIRFKAMSPRVRSDLFCALRLPPAGSNPDLNAWKPLFHHESDLQGEVADGLLSGDTARVRPLVLEAARAENPKVALELLLTYAAKLGQADAISCLLEQETVLDITAAARLAIVEGHTDCLERLLRAGPSFFPFLSAYAPGVQITARHICLVLDAVQLNDEAALDLLRTRGVQLLFTGTGDDVLTSAHIKFYGAFATTPSTRSWCGSLTS